MNRLMRGALVAAAATFGLAGAANASIIPVLQSVTAEGGNFRYTYQLTLDGDQGLTQGSKISIFDFAGFVPGSISTAASFVGGTELVSGMALPPGQTDAANILNLTFTWNGADYRTSGGEYAPTQYLVSALSTFASTTIDGFSAMAVKNNGVATGTLTANVGSVAVPAVPEPATWLMMIVGFGMVGAGLRTRTRMAGEIA